jgi:peptidoglycan/LPS O-acetylase OafA/YrhL
MQEIKSLTGIRGLAAFYVIIFHWNVELAKLHLGPINSYLKTFMGHGYLSVDLFFVMSGFVLCLSGHKMFTTLNFKDYRSFMYKRFIRIFPLYISVTLLFYFLFKYKWQSLIINLTLFQGLSFKYNNSIIPPGWSLTNEWILYFLFPFLLFAILKWIKKPWILVIIALVILIGISSYRSFNFNWYNYKNLRMAEGFHPVISFTRGLASILRTLADYFLGIFTYFLFYKKVSRPYFKYLVMLLGIALFFPKTDILVICLLPILILYLCQQNNLSNFLSSRFIYFLGLISFSLYLNHYIFIKTYAKIPALLGYSNHYISLVYVITGSILLSIITYYGIENLSMKLLKKKV